MDSVLTANMTLSNSAAYATLQSDVEGAPRVADAQVVHKFEQKNCTMTALPMHPPRPMSVLAAAYRRETTYALRMMCC